jgi:hypothetical protein
VRGVLYSSSTPVNVRDAETAFAEKNWLLTWVHELTKHKRKASNRFSFCTFCSEPLSPAATLDSRKDRNDWYLYDKALKPLLRNTGDLQDRPLPSENSYL